MRNESEDHRPIAWINDGEAPPSAKTVAPPARKEWPPTSLWKNKCNLWMKNDRVGIDPSCRNHRGELNGNKLSRELR